jgi:hypothetical protein
VPLARVKQLLVANPDQFDAAIAEIDRALRARVQELRHSRRRIAQLSGGDRLFVSTEVADYLEQLHLLGISQRGVRMERDIWILMQSVSPINAAVWIRDKSDAIRDPEFRAIYVEYDAAFDWAVEDPRLYKLADRARRWMTRRQTTSKDGAPPVQDPAIAQLIATSAGVSSPAWDRLTQIGRELASRG